MINGSRKIFKLLLLLLVTTTTILFTCNFLSWEISFVLIAILFAVSTFDEWLAYTVYLSLFSCAIPIFEYTFVLLVFCCAIKYFLDVKKKRKKFCKLEFLLTIFFVLIWTANFRAIDIQGFYQWRQITCVMFLIFFVYIYNSEVNIEKCFNFMFLVIIVSFSVSMIFIQQNYNLSQIFFSSQKRIRMFTTNPNILAFYCCCGIAFILTRMMIKLQNLKWKKVVFSFTFPMDIILVLLFMFLGIFTQSKAFFVIFNFSILYFIIFLIKKYKVYSIPSIVLILSLLFSIQYAFNDEFTKTINRFFEAKENQTFYEVLNNLFTYRPEIWLIYLQDSLSSVFNLLFGVGFLTPPLVSSPHSSYVFVLHRVGLIGIIYLTLLTFSYSKHAQSKPKINFSNMLFLIVLVLFALEEVIVAEKMILFVIFGFLILVKKDLFSLDQTKQ